MTRELCLCEACVKDRQSQHNAPKTPISREEYNRLVFEQLAKLRQIVSDFYEIEEPVS